MQGQKRLCQIAEPFFSMSKKAFVGADAHIGPIEKVKESAKSKAKRHFLLRVDVGIDPYGRKK